MTSQRRPVRDDDDDDRPRRRRDEEESNDPPRRSRRDDPDDDARPRRARRDEDDEDRPRRARREDEDEERPRRRRRDEEDEGDEQDRIRPRRKSKTPSMGSMDVFIWIGMAVGAVVVVGVVVWIVSSLFHNPFREQIPSYTFAAGAPILPGQPRPPVTRVVAVDMKGSLDPVHWSLDSAHRAEKPADVTTVLQLRWDGRVFGRYSGGGIATQWHVDATLVDLKTKAVLGTRHMVGSQPPQTIRVSRGSSAGASGDKPIDQITAFVREMAAMK